MCSKLGYFLGGLGSTRVEILHLRLHCSVYYHLIVDSLLMVFFSYIYLFIGVVLASSTLVSLAYTLYVIGIIRAVRVIHELLIKSVLHATLR